ncbi:MAG: bifunctional ornithine acetyltransferase/N-acetylglutamate synthase [Roseiflexaceae bacterium]|nr:bifunctional ornithine acetyltransferase/N-acetylglutamate synthase [Roseiflexus sp.]MDW8211985.1 bifunctional ornithine acetyltransferase/N-acetylglutamate synthase [Roseiflexaceae bacterium]
MSYNIIEDGHISSPAGFRATGVSCGLKEIRARDLAIVYSRLPCRVGALFTTNLIVAAPIFFNQAILARNRDAIRAVVINAGHANAGTGQPGLATVVECAKIAADELEIPRDSVLMLSTGQIGVAPPLDRMREGIRRAASELDSNGGRRAALAILTSDTRPKERAFRVSLREGRTVTLAGMAKGSRMVSPHLATLLCVITTDAPIESRLLMRALDQSVSRSFGRLHIDGDMSPNDAVLVLANGAAGGPPIVDGSRELGVWQQALDALCHDLAQQVLRDAASGGKHILITVRGASTDAAASQVARAVARSTAVRHMCARNLPDWGGMLVAVGASGVDLRPDLLELRIGAVTVMDDGLPTRFDQSALVQALSGPEVELVIDLHTGAGTATVWTCTTGVEP